VGWIYKLDLIGLLFGKGELAACLKEREMTMHSTVHYETIRGGVWRLFSWLGGLAGWLIIIRAHIMPIREEEVWEGVLFGFERRGVRKEGRKEDPVVLYI